ncbi:hypothetical protein GCM10023084_42630 [Streptomyces lacrimifluminis]|uniref:Uncharacterized protein n=1 Tax=Streptomyces lacrimifluminis TaxID=1500077 RepID=A0A917KGT9_9ACTN|nr:hypothetical protein GCM10012282_05220 [Streptomyces lacrimifluminis]
MRNLRRRKYVSALPGGKSPKFCAFLSTPILESVGQRGPLSFLPGCPAPMPPGTRFRGGSAARTPAGYPPAEPPHCKEPHL